MAKKKPSSEQNSGQHLPIPIVAIGASAGGIEAFSDLLRHLSPTTGLAYVYIQHLDPTVESHIPDILGRVTSMPVLEAEHLLQIKPDHVYVIPPDRDLEVLDGALTLLPRVNANSSGIHMPIDQFFLSLADRQKDGSIAVILSGTASDGTLGMRAIKAAGGITFAQDDTAKFQSMPRSAISEGVVDRVLPPVEIAKELERLSRQSAVFQQTSLAEIQEEEDTADEDLRTIIQLLRRMTGVDFTHYKVTTVRRRIIRRTLLYKLDNLREYIDYLRTHPEEASMLYDDLLINVTSFFRDAETMDYLQKVLLPQLIRDKPNRDPLRVWIPACSTGQEAYSIAMLLLEVLGDRAASMTIQIFATDLSESAVAKARLGSYTRGEVIGISTWRLQRFFTKVDDHYRINKSVRDLCVFAPHNLLKDPPFSRLDLISCRNLLIYLDTTLQRKAIVTFHYALNPSGYLLLGKSETVGSSAPLFSQIEKNYKIYLRKNDVDSRATFSMSPRQVDGSGQSAGIRALQTPKSPNPSAERFNHAGNDLDKVVDNLLLTQYIPACVLVNQDLEILQFRGSTGLYLEPSPGKASLNLLKMARPSLVFELRSTIHKAQKLGEPIRKNGLEVRLKDKVHYVAIEAVPLNTNTEERLFLIIFEEVEPPIVPATKSADARNRRIKELEDELSVLRDDMRSIIEEQEASNEELQSANEEIISSNEELQSINEELETSKEEIESTNEELLTINQELQVRNDQLSEAYQFAEDIFGTIREATLVLDTELRVKSANQTFYRIFGTSEQDTERRLIYELGNRQWDIPELRLMLTDVATHGTQFQGFEFIYSTPGISAENTAKVLSLNARRVVRQQEAILLAIEDITEHRRAQQLLAEREAWFHQIADNAPSLIWVTGPDGKYTFINKVWADYTGRTLDDITRFGWAPNLHPDDRKGYQDAHDTFVNRQQPFSFEYRLRRYDGEYHWMLENAQPVFAPDGTFGGYIGSSADVNLQKELNQELDRRVQERTAELANSTNLLESVFDSSLNNVSVLACVRDHSGELIDFSYQLVNQTNEQALGRTDLEGKLYSEINRTFRESGLFDILKRVVETGKPERFQLHYTIPASQWHDCSAVKLNDGVVLSFEDITARKKIEAQIRESEEGKKNLLSIFGQAPVAIAMFKGASFVVDLANELMLGFWSRTAAEVMGKPLSIALPEMSDHQFVETLQRVYSTAQRVIVRELPLDSLRRGATEKICIDFVFEPYYGSDDAVAGVLVVGNDVTQQVRARQQVENSERLFRTLVENTPDLISRWNADLTLQFANRAFMDRTEIPENQTLGKTFQEMGAPADIAVPYMARLQEVFNTGEPKEHFNSYQSPVGELIFHSRMVPEIAETGDVESVLAIARDITKLQQAENLIVAEGRSRELAESLQAVLDSSPTLIVFFKAIDDPNSSADEQKIIDFRVAVCNDKIARILGQSAEQLIGQSATLFADMLWHEHTLDTLRHVRETSEPYYEERSILVNQSTIWMAIYVTRFDNGVVVTGVDITQLKEAELQQDLLLRQIEQSNESIQSIKQLRQHIRERGEFLRSTSHDLRGNFGIIQGAATLLDLANTDEERNQMLAMLQRNLKQVTDMLLELMDFSRLESGQETRQIVPFNASELLNGLVESVRPLADERGLWLVHTGNESLIVEGDPVKVRRIAQNLLLNALKYTQTGGATVNWGDSSTPDHWQFTIVDTGPGFSTIDAATEKTSIGGEGIGLLIVRQLCELLNGHFQLDSTPDGGTCVQVTFPKHY